jgi:tyrosyl-tRNA synthetase
LDPATQLEFLSANAAEVIPKEEFEAKLRTGRPLRVKLGLDPTAKDVTLGWAVVLRKLREFQDFGHTAVLIIGDFTAQIGDPSGKDETRPMLTKEEVEAHARNVLEQFDKILSKDNLEIRRNSEWLEALGVAGLLEVSTHHTVARMLERNDFAERYAAGQPISVREFMYPLLQGYDSIAVEADVELGGTDQHFNLLVGRHLQRAYGQEPQVVLEMPLLEGTDGVQKMSQSLGNYIAITEAPNDIFGKVMRVPDEIMPKYFRLATAVAPDEIDAIVRGRPEEAKRRLAEEVVSLYHGRDAARDARAHFDRVFKEHSMPESIVEADIPSSCVTDGRVDLPALVEALGFAASKSEARRKIQQGGVRIDDAKVARLEVGTDEISGKILRVGKLQFAKLK